jgi:hypothetical protein
MIRFKRQVTVALAVCTVALGVETPSPADALTNQPVRKAPRNPHDNGPRDRGGQYGSPEYYTKTDYFNFPNRGWAILDVLRNDTYPDGARWGIDSAGYAYIDIIDCPDSNRRCIYYDPTGGPREYADRVEYHLSDAQDRNMASGEAYVTMP